MIESHLAAFKEAGLSQEQAQAVVNAQAKREAQIVQAGKDAWIKTNTDWANETKTEFGSKLPEVRATIGRALATLPEEVRGPFRQAMDMTGAGNNPAFVRVFFAMAKKMTEGSSVAGAGPSPAGQSAPGARPPSAASAIYPNLN